MQEHLGLASWLLEFSAQVQIICPRSCAKINIFTTYTDDNDLFGKHAMPMRRRIVVIPSSSRPLMLWNLWDCNALSCLKLRELAR